MKKSDIPQDDSKLSKNNVRELCYVVNEDGTYTTGLSSGWEPKSIALNLSIEHFNEQIENAKKEVLAGLKSPIYYFMWKEKMDTSVLAAYMGKFRWTIKRHFKPNVFKKLNPRIKEKYAEVFDIDLNRLENFNE